MKPDRTASRLIGLTLLALLLFTPPLLLLFDRPTASGLSLLPLYLLLAWIGIIGGAAWILERDDEG